MLCFFSPPSPVLGLGIVKDELLGSTMLTLTSDFEFQRLRLRYVFIILMSQCMRFPTMLHFDNSLLLSLETPNGVQSGA